MIESTKSEVVEHAADAEVVEHASSRVLEWVNGYLREWGCSQSLADIIDEWVLLLLIVIFALLVDVVLRRVVLRIVRNIVRRTKASWDDLLFDHNVLVRMCSIVVPLTIYALLPLAFAKSDAGSAVATIISRVVEIYIVVSFVRFFNAILKMAFEIADNRPSLHGRPIKGLMQTGQVIVLCVAAILVVAILIDKSPVMLLTGLGASAAVLMLIFQNSILGLVAGIQLSVNKMLKVGDWISMPSHNVDGIVEEVALTTVKIRGWDNTLQTIPPYLLISEPFDNWQAMFESGGRRIKRSINIDMTSVKFADVALLERINSNEAARVALEDIKTKSDEGTMVTNLDLFTRSLNRFLARHPRVNGKMLILVRQLQPTQWGLPIELYCFSANVGWVAYETLQAEIISYVVALAPYFDLKVYQAPSSYDIKA
ncbi:MAG: mechanosensitive ion channel [Alistipes sp.]|nr:mechanosensitive ion channel [Alistipes sp.]